MAPNIFIYLQVEYFSFRSRTRGTTCELINDRVRFLLLSGSIQYFYKFTLFLSFNQCEIVYLIPIVNAHVAYGIPQLITIYGSYNSRPFEITIAGNKSAKMENFHAFGTADG